MPFSLAEHTIAQTEPLKKGVYLGLTRACIVADMLEWENTGSLTTSGVRYDGVNRPSWVPLNTAFPERTIRGKNLSYGVYQMGLHIDIPHVLEKDSGVKERPSTRQTRQAIIGAAYEMNDAFVNGDQGADPNRFEGVEKIATALGTSQNIGSSEIDVRLSQNPTTATIQAFIDRIDEAIDAVDGREPDFALCSRRFGLTARSLFRRAQLMGDHHDWIKNGLKMGDIRQTLATAATRPMFVYNGVPFYDIGPMVDEFGAESDIIANDYNEYGSTSATRVFFIKQGRYNLQGLQFSPLKVEKVADTLEDRPVERHRLTWLTGLGAWSKNCVSVARGIRVA